MAAVACVAGVMIIASQVLATVEPMRAPDPVEEVQVVAGDPTPTTTTTALVPSTTTTAPLPPITGPVRLNERSALDGRGIGPVESGMTITEAEQAAGRRFRVVDREDAADRCYAAVPEGLVGLRFVVEGTDADPREGRIMRVEAVDSGWATVSDARVGSSVTEVRRIYGRRLRGKEADGLLTVPVSDGGRSFAVGFVTSQRGVVAELRSGDAKAVAQPEGCS